MKRHIWQRNVSIQLFLSEFKSQMSNIRINMNVLFMHIPVQQIDARITKISFFIQSCQVKSDFKRLNFEDEEQWLVWLSRHAMGSRVKRWEGWAGPNTLLTNILGQVYNSNEGPHRREANAHPQRHTQTPQKSHPDPWEYFTCYDRSLLETPFERSSILSKWLLFH